MRNLNTHTHKKSTAESCWQWYFPHRWTFDLQKKTGAVTPECLWVWLIESLLSCSWAIWKFSHNITPKKKKHFTLVYSQQLFYWASDSSGGPESHTLCHSFMTEALRERRVTPPSSKRDWQSPGPLFVTVHLCSAPLALAAPKPVAFTSTLTGNTAEAHW